MNRSIRAISACWRSIARPSAISRAAASRRHWCHVPLKNRARPASSSSTAVPTVSRNQRSCATSTTAASSPTSVSSSHSSDSMSRWFVGSSSSSRSGWAAGAGGRAGGRAAGELPARERLRRPVEVGVGEAEAMDDRPRALAPSVAAGRLEAGVDVGIALQRRLVAPGHRGLEAPELGLELERLAAAREHVLAQRQVALARRALVVQRDPHALAEDQLAAVDRRLPREHPQERRLAGAVAPGDRQPLAALEFERDAAQERLAGHVLGQVGCGEERPPPLVETAGGAGGGEIR